MRARFEEKGVSFGLSYTAEASTNGAGGQYLGSLASTALFDLTHLGFGRGQCMSARRPCTARDPSGRVSFQVFEGRCQSSHRLMEKMVL